MPGNDIPGGFASHIVVPAGSLCEVPVDDQYRPISTSGVTLAELSVLADAITTPYQSIVESGLSSEDTAIFIGIGGVGGFGAQIAHALGALVVAVDIDPDKLKAIAPYVDITFNALELPAKELKKPYPILSKAGKSARRNGRYLKPQARRQARKRPSGFSPMGHRFR